MPSLARTATGFLAAAILLAATHDVAAQPHDQAALDARVSQFLEERAGRWRDLNVPPSDGQLLHDLIVKHGYTRALEIGTSTGHSGVWIAWALSKTGERLVTVEIDESRHREALANFEAAGLSRFIDARLGNAHEIVPALEGPFDFVFSDAAGSDAGCGLRGCGRRRPSCREERAQQCRGLLGQHAFHHLDPVVEVRQLQRPQHGRDRTGPRLPRAEHQPRDARVHQRARTHEARLNRDVQVCTRQAVTAHLRRRGPQRDDLGVRRGVLRADRPVEALAHDAPVHHHDRADRYFALRRGSLRELQRTAHGLHVHAGHWHDARAPPSPASSEPACCDSSEQAYGTDARR